MATLPHACLAPELWAVQVASRACLPDKRLDKRLADILATFASKPLDSIPQAFGSITSAKATYDFFKNKRFDSDDLLRPLVETTAESCRGVAKILAIQDTTSLNYTTLRHTTGLGPLNDSAAQGLHLHTTIALRTDGVPVGLLHQQWWSRPAEKRSTDKPDHRPIEEKESAKWLNGVNAVDIAFLEMLDAERPQLVHIMDREGDIHEVLQLVTDLGHGAIIRASQNRSVAGPINKAYQAVAAAPLLGRHDVDVPANHGQEKRRARLELRAVTLTITPCCKHKNQQHRRPVTWTLIEAREINAPVGVVEPLKWLLWTTEPAETLADVIEVLRLYKLRWRIEDFHLTLKSGCRTEALELETAVRLAKAITLYSAVAVRIVSMRDLARKEPDAPCTTILSEDAWKVLWILFNKKTLTADVPVPTIKQAVLWIGRLGGHLNRKSDGMPGVRTLWRGWRDLILLVTGFRNARSQR